jgi:4-hydroxythreonine-4-phosphate dehydrogenase
MGDPAGVGPELCLRLLNNREIASACTPIVFGDRDLLKRVAEAVAVDSDFHCVELGAVDRLSLDRLDEVTQPAVAHVRSLDAAAVEPGQIDANTGQGSFDFIEAAIAAAHAGLIDSVVTGPINKEAWDAAGVSFPGHTELFADRCQCDRFCMMMYSTDFSCSLVTTHIGYSSVPEELTHERIVEVIELSHNAIKRIEGRTPEIAVLGLNPHAGEHGLFGNQEEEKVILPAMQTAQARGISTTGPLPPDTGFLPKKRDATDVYICMYHDQGLIPFKAFNFDSGVNVTLGLPMVRTSVDHGTANDIAWQGVADPESLYSAVRLAIALCDD